VLVLSANRVSLYEGDERTLHRSNTSKLPESLEDALGSKLTEPSLQLHTTGRSGAEPVYHGQGGSAEGRRVDLERFHRLVARGLEAEIGTDVLPLVLAADGRHRPGLERALGRDVGLLAKQLEGNAEHLSVSALHAAAWPIVSEAHEVPSSRTNGDTPFLAQVSEVVLHAVMGRIRRLRVPGSGEIPGSIDHSNARAAEGWGDDDLIEHLIVEVLRRGGSVEVMEEESFGADSEGLRAELRSSRA
jgi:hypothetical protein